MGAFRDELKRDPDGRAIIELASDGPPNAEQSIISDVALHIPPKILESEACRDEIDSEALSRSLIIASKSVLDPFKQKLCSLFPHAKLLERPADLHKFDAGDMLISVAPVKGRSRAQGGISGGAF